MLREIVTIDQEKCDGCGLCVPACAEGAIRIENGKAKLVADRLCDGVGACLGHCPRGAIQIEKREAAEFDEHAAAKQREGNPGRILVEIAPAYAGGCPSQRFARLDSPPAGKHPSDGTASDMPTGDVTVSDGTAAAARSELGQWPVQLRLVPPRAPVFQGADLLLTADCVPFALPNFHEMLRGHALAIACPKLDDTSSYVPKLTEIIAGNRLRSITVMHMEVPCCTGILMMAIQAREASGANLPIEDVVVSIRGEILSRRQIPIEPA